MGSRLQPKNITGITRSDCVFALLTWLVFVADGMCTSLINDRRLSRRSFGSLQVSAFFLVSTGVEGLGFWPGLAYESEL